MNEKVRIMRSTTSSEIKGNFSDYDHDLPVLCCIHYSVVVDLDSVLLFLISKIIFSKLLAVGIYP